MRSFIIFLLIGIYPACLNAQSKSEAPITRLQAKTIGVNKIYTYRNKISPDTNYVFELFEYDTLGNLILWKPLYENGPETSSFTTFKYRDTTIQKISKCYIQRGFQHWEISYFDNSGRITRFADSTEIVNLITNVKSTDYIYHGDTTIIISANEEGEIIQSTLKVLKDALGTEVTTNLLTGITTTKEWGLHNSYKITTKKGDSIIYLGEVKFDSVNRMVKSLEFNHNIVEIFEYTYNPYSQQYTRANKMSGTNYNEYVTYDNNHYRIVETTNNKKEIKTGRLDDEVEMIEADCGCFCPNELMQAMPDIFEGETVSTYDTLTNKLLMKKVFEVNPANKEKSLAKTFFYDSNGLLIKLEEGQYYFITFRYEFY
ncbi:MAG: hypothetical protein IPI65_22085 [Bacteroidetes bacterium]|nr:hypothetical protein [Bacteroidota bacterium]